MERLGGLGRWGPMGSVLSRDMLEQYHAAPKASQLTFGKVRAGDFGIDNVQSRRSGLSENEFPFPRGGLLDRAEDWNVDKEGDFYYVDDGPVAESDLLSRLPYSGPCWYWKKQWRSEGCPRHSMEKMWKSHHCNDHDIC